MRRVRAVFALLALVLLVAAGILVQRAVAGVEAERKAQRETLAERIFDEMERALSEWLAGEESVAVADWLRPPAADPPFVVARFETGPGDALRLSPSSPPRLGTWLAAWASRRAAGQPAVRPAAPSRSRQPAPSPATGSVYDALQSLNRGAESRAQRAQKHEMVLAAEAPAAAPEPKRSDAAPAPAAEESVRPEGFGEAAGSGFAVDPLLGDRLDDGSLLLVRTVLSGDHGHRQGLVLDSGALGEWLRGSAVGAGPLQGAEVAFRATDRAMASSGGVVHRFAEPFDGLEAELTLPALRGSGSAATVLQLSVLLVLAAGAGLLALYRMVAVALRFAEQRSSFVAAVSHELKTPLTAIRMYGEMLRDGLVPSEEKRAEYYRTITAESERLSRLIDNVLEFARADRGERPLSLRRGPLAVEVAAVCESLRPHAAQDGFTLVFAASPGLPPVAFDRDAVAQIVVNLVDNALKYARDAARREVRVECAEQEGGVSLRVRDFGPGVATRDLARIFELFQRGESDLTRTTRGTGLGLALVRSLAQRMGARVSAGNAQEGGLEVTIVFPRPPDA